MDIITRAGLANGSLRKPCKHGWVALWCRSITPCVLCAKERTQTPEYKAARRVVARVREQRPDVKAIKKKARTAREQTEKGRAAKNALRGKRRAAELQRTPAWADHKVIARIYTLAVMATELAGFSYHLEHIYPLQGETVCGLHVHENLRWFEGRANCSKHNAYPIGEADAWPAWVP
jgi:hypothetical protein